MPPPAPPTAPIGYIPPRGERPGSELGKPWWPIESAKSRPGPAAESQFIPSPHDAYRYVGQVGAQQAKFGAPAVAGPAQQVSMLAAGFAPLFDLISRGAFSQGFSEGNALQIQKKLGALKVEQEQFVLQSEMMQREHQKLLLQYGDVFNAAENHWITPEEATERLRIIAGNNQDTMTLEQLKSYGMKGALAHLQREDRMMRMAMAGTTSLKKMTEGEKSAAEEMASQGYKTDISDQGLGSSSAFNFPGLEGDGKAGGEQTGTAIAQADTGEAEGGDDAEAFDAMEQKKHTAFGQPITPETIQLGRQAYHGDFDPKELKATRGLVEGVASDLRQSVEKIASGPGDAQTKLDRIEKLDPTTGDKLKGLLDYSLDPEKDLPAAHQARENLTTLAHSINPNWKSSTFAIVKKYHDANTSEGLRVQRVSSLDGALWSLNNVLGRLPEGEKVPANVMKAWIAGHLSGDPKWDELYTSIRNIAQDTIAIETGSGRPAVTLVNDMLKHMLATNSPTSIRSQAIIDMRTAYGQVVTLRDQFRSETGDPNAQLPFLGRDVNDKFLAYMRQNPHTGEMPSDAPQSLLAVGKKLNPKDMPPGMRPTTAEHPGDELPPMTKAEIYEAWDKLDELNRQGTDVARKKAQWLRERLGYFADRGTI
jgi:hypothetical protein